MDNFEEFSPLDGTEDEYTKAEEQALLKTMNYVSALDSVMDMDKMLSASFSGLDGSGEYDVHINEDDEEYKLFSAMFKTPEVDFSAFEFDGDPDYFCEDSEVAADVAKALGLF